MERRRRIVDPAGQPRAGDCGRRQNRRAASGRGQEARPRGGLLAHDARAIPLSVTQPGPKYTPPEPVP